MRGRLWIAGALALACGRALAESNIETIQVTATRLPESVGDVPADVSIISGDELRERQSNTLAGALALTAGVEAPPGGDSGPSSAVPSFWGLHEFDDFLLVVDKVPWGSPFNPAIGAVDFNDVQRIEVLKGSAPVAYGATSFVGVIHVLHYPAGEAANLVQVGHGNYDSWRAAGSIALPDWGDYRQSLAADSERLGFADRRETVGDTHLLYRGAIPLGRGTFRIDGDASLLRDVPPSPIVRVGDALTHLTPINGNYNPANARMDDSRYHVSLGYDAPTALGDWSTLLSLAHSDIRDIRGFLRPDLTNDGSPNADSQDQHRLIQAGYFDTHLTHAVVEDLELTIGTDLLFGLGRQRSVNGVYFVPLSGQVVPPPTKGLHVDEMNTVRDKRLFGGQYAELDWGPAANWDVDAGVRLNETFEDKISGHIDGFDTGADESAQNTHTTIRPSGSVGVSYRPWKHDDNEAVLYADYRNSFQPSEVDFGPDYTPDLLKPETGESYEAGIKGALLDGRLAYDLEGFLMNLSNLVVAETDASGNPALANAGGERLKGVELETRYNFTPDLGLAANISWHDARFSEFVLDEGDAPHNVSGNQLTLSPHTLASAGLLYAPANGFHGNLTVNYIGSRFLDEENHAPTPAYTTVAATAGYRFGRYDLVLITTNLTNRRPPVTQSEFGDSSYYLLPARSLWVQLSASL